MNPPGMPDMAAHPVTCLDTALSLIVPLRGFNTFRVRTNESGPIAGQFRVVLCIPLS